MIRRFLNLVTNAFGKANPKTPNFSGERALERRHTGEQNGSTAPGGHTVLKGLSRFASGGPD